VHMQPALARHYSEDAATHAEQRPRLWNPLGYPDPMTIRLNPAMAPTTPMNWTALTRSL
jgi:hypothetical protein